MEYKKYHHIERFGTTEVENIELGKCYIFPKLDGTNASLWWDGKYVCGGSRNREVTKDNDNAGFLNWAVVQPNIRDFFKKNPNVRLYGEWLVPHSLKTYREEAWRRFYVFDVQEEDKNTHMPYEEYQVLLEEFNIDYIPPIKIISNGDYDDFVFQLKNNIFMIKDGKGAGEGIVIKDYNFINRFGRQTWAKIVTSEFKERHYKEMGAPEVVKRIIEDDIVEEFVTIALCEKVYAKIANSEEGFNSRKIPELLNTVYYDLVKEESWTIVKKYKNPTINFKILKHRTFGKVRENLPNLF